MRREIIESVDDIDKQFQMEAARTFDEFSSEYPNYSLDLKFSTLIGRIYGGREEVNISGAQADYLCEEVDQKSKDHQGMVADQLKLYKQKMFGLIQQAKQLKK